MANNISLGIIIGAALSGSFGNAFRSASQQASNLGRSLQQIRLGRTAAQDVDRLSSELVELRAAQALAGTGDAALNRQIADTERQLDRARRSAERYGVDLTNLTGETDRLTRAEQRLGGQLARTNQRTRERENRSRLGSSMLGTAGMAIGAGFAVAAPVKEAIEFESKMADIRKVGDMTSQELKVLGKEIIKSSTLMPMSAVGIGSIVEVGLQSNIAKNEILGFTNSAVKMGVAFGMSGDEAGKTMASWRAGMAISQKEAESLADAVNYLDSNMNATAASISEVIMRQGAVAKASGLSTIQTAALSAALLNSGVQSEIAATALKNMTNALTRGGSATKAQLGVYKKLGLSSKKVAQSMQKDAEGTIKTVFNLLSKRPKAEQSSLVGDLFGEEAKGAIMPLLVNLKALDDAFNSVGDATKFAGSMQKEYEIRSKTTENNAQLLSNKFDALKISVGSALLPALNEVFGVIGNGAMKIGAFAEKFPRVIEVVTGLGIGLIGLKLVTLAGLYGFSLLTTAWTLGAGAAAFLSNAMLGTRIGLIALNVQTWALALGQKAMAVWTGTVTAAQWLWNAALSANPIGLVIIGITALGALAYTVYKNWDPIMAWFRENFAWLGTAVDKVKGYADKLGQFMTTPVIGAQAGTRGSVGSLGNALTGGGSTQAGARGSLSDFGKPHATTPLPAMGTPGGASSGPRIVNITNHVTQKPGEDSNALADRIVKRIKNQEAADKRGALHD